MPVTDYDFEKYWNEPGILGLPAEEVKRLALIAVAYYDEPDDFS